MKLFVDRFRAGLMTTFARDILRIAAVGRGAVRRACRLFERDLAKAREMFAALGLLVDHGEPFPRLACTQTERIFNAAGA